MKFSFQQPKQAKANPRNDFKFKKIVDCGTVCARRKPRFTMKKLFFTAVIAVAAAAAAVVVTRQTMNDQKLARIDSTTQFLYTIHDYFQEIFDDNNNNKR